MFPNTNNATLSEFTEIRDYTENIEMTMEGTWNWSILIQYKRSSFELLNLNIESHISKRDLFSLGQDRQHNINIKSSCKMQRIILIPKNRKLISYSVLD